MPQPPKAKLHTKTGRVKNINKTYTSSSSSTATHTNNESNPRNNTSGNSSSQPAQRLDSVPSSNSTNSTSSTSGSGIDSRAIEQFELELCWCIQTLEKSIESGKLSAKQIQDTEKTIRSLKSNNQPIVKKRQLMQSAFGDYRKKMQDEEKKLRTGNTSIQFIDQSVDAKNSKSTNPIPSQGHFVKKSFAQSLGNSNFQFNFAVNEIEKLSLGEQNEASSSSKQCDKATEISKSNGDHTAEIHTSATQTNANPFIKTKLLTSNNSFKFNFTVDCD